MRFLIFSLLMSMMVVMLASHASSQRTPIGPHPEWTNALQPVGDAGPRLVLATDGATEYSIVIPADPSSQDRKAATDLAHWLNMITGADFPIINETDEMNPGDPIISLGRTRMLAESGLSQSDEILGPEGAAIASEGRTLYLFGGHQRGPIYAVYIFLEEDLGCRWYMPRTSTIPSKPTLEVNPVTRVSVPALERREPYYHESFERDWTLRNRIASVHSPLPEEWGGYPKFTGHFVHTFNLFMPPGEFFDDHPEYFSENDGERTPRQLCMTHPDVRRIFAERVIGRLNRGDGARYVDVSPNDWRDYCDCSECSAIRDAEGGYMGPLLDFVNDVADRIAEHHPDVTVTTFAYLGTIMPPKNIRPRLNVQITLCSDSHAWEYYYLKVTDTVEFQTALEEWSRLDTNICIWDYQYVYRQFMQPLPNLRISADNLRHFADYGVQGVFLQGGPWGIDRGPLRCWVMSKLTWNPDLDVDALIRDFYYGYFGAAAEPLYEYDSMLHQTWEQAYSQWKALYPDPVDPDPREYIRIFHPGGKYFENDWIERARDLFDRDFSPEFIDKARELFDDALKLADGDDELRKRIEYASLSVLFLEADRGPTGELRDYLRTVNDLERIALANNVRNARNFEGYADLYDQLTRWRALAHLSPERTFFTDLSNEWKFSPDPDEIGIDEGWYEVDFDDSAWGTVRSDLGHRGWESQGYEEYTVGYGWYRQEFYVPEDFPERPNPRLFFGAVDEEAEIWLNGTKALNHTVQATGMSKDFLWQRPFHFDPVRFLKPGEMNTIAVRVHNILHVGGIWKPVRLVWGDTTEDLYVLEEFLHRQTQKQERAALR